MHLRREILIRDFNKRERVVLELIHQLTVDMKRESVRLLPCDFRVFGIHKANVKPVISNLLATRVILQIESGYRFNPTLSEWQVAFVPGYDRYTYYEFISTQIPDKKSNQIDYKKPDTRNQNDYSTERESNQIDNQLGLQETQVVKKESNKEKNNININNKNLERISSSQESAPSIQSLLTLFQTAFQNTIGQPYQIEYGKDQKLLNQLIAKYGAEHIHQAMKRFFQLRTENDPYLSQTAMSIGVFYKTINRLNNLLSQKEVNPHSNSSTTEYQKDTAEFLARIRATRTIQFVPITPSGKHEAAGLGSPTSG